MGIGLAGRRKWLVRSVIGPQGWSLLAEAMFRKHIEPQNSTPRDRGVVVLISSVLGVAVYRSAGCDCPGLGGLSWARG